MVKKDKAATKADKRTTSSTADNKRNKDKPHTKQHKHNRHSSSAQPAYTDFATQLASLHLRLQHIDGDGNCLFRSISDQIEGIESNHAHYRQLACTHITQHSELYAPFIDGGDGGKAGGGLKAYVTRMSRTGEWGGNLELVALARALQRDVVVHQLGAPRLVIDGEVKGKGSGSRSGALHLAYHDREHYSSVRRADDHSVHTEPLPITLPASIAHTAQQQPAATGPTADERRVMAATGINDLGRVRAALRDIAGDVDSAVEVLNAERDAQLQNEEQQPAVAVEEKEGSLAEEASEPTGESVAAEEVKDVDEVVEPKVAAGQVKEVKASKAKMSTKDLKKALKAERAEKKVQRALERKLDRMKERAKQAGDGEKGDSATQAANGTESVVPDFGSLSI